MNIAHKFVENDIFNVILTGGEPMMRPNLLIKLVEYLSSNNINVMVNSNITLLTEEILECFMKNKIRNVLVSCPSYKEDDYNTITGTHGYQTFLEKLDVLIASGQRFSTNMVVNQYNKNDVFKTAEFLKARGVKNFGATPMALNPLYPRKDLLLTNDEVYKMILDLGEIEKKLNLKIDVMEALPKCSIPFEFIENDIYFTRRKCQAGLTVCAVSGTGEVRPCTHNVKSYGNILKEPLTEIWNRMKEWRDLSLVPEKCKPCKLLSRCQGGCRINALTINGCINGDDIWSQPEKKLPDIKIIRKYDLTSDTPLRKTRVPLHIREENDDMFIMCGYSGNQSAFVSKEVMNLLDAIGDKQMTVREIAAMGERPADDHHVREILKHLIGRNILLIEN